LSARWHGTVTNRGEGAPGPNFRPRHLPRQTANQLLLCAPPTRPPLACQSWQEMLETRRRIDKEEDAFDADLMEVPPPAAPRPAPRPRRAERRRRRGARGTGDQRATRVARRGAGGARAADSRGHRAQRSQVGPRDQPPLHGRGQLDHQLRPGVPPGVPRRAHHRHARPLRPPPRVRVQVPRPLPRRRSLRAPRVPLPCAPERPLPVCLYGLRIVATKRILLSPG
jgi:hypothetical protein